MTRRILRLGYNHTDRLPPHDGRAWLARSWPPVVVVMGCGKSLPAKGGLDVIPEYIDAITTIMVRHCLFALLQ